MDKQLTDIQKKILKKNGKFVVRACPGSGKTFTVAAKMAKLLKNWSHKHQGVAVLSFTNVAWQEIEKELKNTFDVNIPIQHPHFLRTIDSFVNNFIFLHYGHLILECEDRPVLVGEPAYPWKMKNYNYDPYQYFDKTSYDFNGDFSPTVSLDKFHFQWKKTNSDGSLNRNYSKLIKMKENLLKKGFANQADIDYFSMKLLEKYPNIAETIALRFPFFIIDEAQDTSKIQMHIIDILVENGLENIILVGDPDQAIFEWRDAEPELFNEKAQEWDMILMNENWRSSQNICNFSYKVASLNEQSIAVNNELTNFPHKPEIWEYDKDNPNFNEILSKFLELCESKNISLDPFNVAILSRSKNLMSEIISLTDVDSENKAQNGFNPWLQSSYAKELMVSKYLYDKAQFQKSFEILEKTYLGILEGNPVYSDYELSELIKEEGYFNFKNKIFDLINLMPQSNITIGEWIDEFKGNLTNSNFANLKRNLDIKEGYENLKFDELFANYKDKEISHEYLLSTIHKVKGETFEAILLILKKRGTGAHYTTLLRGNKKTMDSEEIRNVYVGITRPRKILVLAVPSDDKDIWMEYFGLLESPQSTLDGFF